MKSDLGNKEVMARNIQRYMDLHGKSRIDMCKALDVKYTTFCDWVNGKTYPRIDKIEKMANYFHVSKAHLVEENYKEPTTHTENVAVTLRSTDDNLATILVLIELSRRMNTEQLNDVIKYAEYVLSK